MIIIRIAWRNVWRNKVRSIVIITSVALGLLAGTFMLGLYDGMLWSRVRAVIDTEVSHIQFHHPKFKEDYEASFTVIGQHTLLTALSTSNFVSEIAPRSIANGMLATGTGSSGVQIIGVDPERENKVSQLSSKLVEGGGFVFGKKNQVLIGKKLADKMKLRPGSKLVLTFTDAESSIVSGAFRVAGIYQSSNAPLDERNVYVHISDMNALLGLHDACHEIAVLLKRDDDLDLAKAAFQSSYPDYRIENWKEVSPETRMMIESTDQYSIIFIIIIMLALMFGIINTMLMAILERTREIGMLIALGMNKFRLFMLVLWETILLTIAGVPFGFALAWSIINYFNREGIDVSSFAGEAMSGFGFSSMIYPAFPWAKLLTVFTIVISTALVASLLPSYKALRLEPVEAIRQ